MRNPPVRVILSVSLFFLVLSAVPVRAQSATAPKAPPPTTAPGGKEALPKPQPSELEQLFAEALVHNPDIRVGEAKLREAEAELNRVRLQVLQKVTTLYHAVQAQKDLIGAAENSLQAAPPQGRENGALALAQEKAKMASLQAEFPALLGRPPQRGKDSGHTESMGVLFLDSGLYDVPILSNSRLYDVPIITNSAGPFSYWSGRIAGTEGASFEKQQGAQGALMDMICKALDTTVTLDFKDKPLREVLKFFEQRMGVSFHILLPNKLEDEATVTLHLKQVPLGATLQALEDTFDADNRIGIAHLRFAVRDYGILVTTRDRLPQGATLLHAFWKANTRHEKRTGTALSDKSNEQSSLPANLEGVITATDPQSGLVTLNIGSDAGLRKGHALEVYRLKPQPLYLGPIQILSVRPTEAVAKPASGSHTVLEVGDRVTSTIRPR
jgi:hypothetical protein